MYCQFYGMREKPFSLLPDPEFLFFSKKHEKALNLLELGILNQSGFCVISGEIGAGKTTLVRELLNRLDERVRVGLISNTNSTFSDLLSWILAAYELDSESSEAIFQYRRFTDFVIEQYAGGKRTLLIIDEAQNLSLSALEQLRMLSNINSEKDLVLQIILIGQNELRTKLQQPELEQFAQRIAIDYHLEALDQEETAAYIRHRAIKSGGSQQLFDDAACRLVYQYSDGIPRLINRICDLSLVYGFTKSKKIIDADLVEAVTEDQQIDQLITKMPAAPSKSITPPEKLATKRKDASAPAQPSILQSKPTQTSTIEKSADLKPAEKKAVKKTVKPTDKKTETQLTHAASPTLYTATEKASADKTQAESVATEISSVAGTLVEKSIADTALAERAEAENLIAGKEATEKATVEKAASEQAAASMAAAKLAESEKIAAERTAKKLSSAAEQATESSVEKTQTADKLVTEKARVETQTLKQAEAAKTAAGKALAERIAAEKVAAEAAAACDATARKATANRVAAEKAAADMVSDSESAAKRALTRQADAERSVTKKVAADKAASEKARADTELAKKAAAETAAAKSAVREKALAAKETAKKAAASRAAAEKTLAEMEAANAIAIDKASLEKIALAELTVSIAATAQQAADRAAAAGAAAQQEASEKEAAAITATRKAAESRTQSDLPSGTQLQIPAIGATQSRTTHRRTRTILAFSVVSVVVAASTWMITRSIDTGAIRNPAVAAGQSFADSSPITEAAALESAIEKSDLQ